MVLENQSKAGFYCETKVSVGLSPLKSLVENLLFLLLSLFCGPACLTRISARVSHGLLSCVQPPSFSL